MMPNARVIIHLRGGNYGAAYFNSVEEAYDFIAAWVQQLKSGIAGGMLTWYGESADRPSAVWLCREVIGMYVPNDSVVTPQERIAAVMEKAVKHEHEGDEWKDNE